jgi:superfamily II DNA or RNA helicase
MHMKKPTIEFHRNAYALIPSASDRAPGVAFYVDGTPIQQFCTCQKLNKQKKKMTCSHLKSLSRVVGELSTRKKNNGFEACFKKSVWYDLATILSQGDHLTPQTVEIKFTNSGNRTRMKVTTREGNVVLAYHSKDEDRNRFADRLGVFSKGQKEAVPDRAEVIRRLQSLTLSEAERELGRLQLKSRRQALEGSLWFRLAYHCFMEFGDDGCSFHPSVDETTGTFVVTCKNGDGETIFHASIARNRVRPLLDSFRKQLPNQHDLPIHPIPLKSLFRVSHTTEMDLDVYPVIQLIQEKGEKRFFSREGLEKFIYGNLVYLPELKILAEFEKPGSARKYVTPKKMTFKRYQIPSFIKSAGDDLDGDGFVIDPDVKGLSLLKKWDSMTLSPSAIDRDWCWLSISYGFGDESISLAQILKSRQEGTRYIGTSSGWVDTQSPEMDALAVMAESLPDDRFEQKGDAVRLNRQELFHFSSMDKGAPTVVGKDKNAEKLLNLLSLEPSSQPLDVGLTSSLRDYQKLGLKWLWWLRENRFGGLLCDDMGLGKTHQIMALMVAIQHQEKNDKPHLVVCPTTVVSHWETKLKQYAPGLNVIVYYGKNRDLEAALETAHVLVTSYGLLQRDTERLNKVSFCLGVFDEMQQIKNPLTKTHIASKAIEAEIKIGLSGTPIENTVADLKALMDVAVPGYLGPDQSFRERFMSDGGRNHSASKNRGQLRQLIFPFTLRRMKERVLDELPEKIEDIQYCELTDHQVKLYRDAIDSRAKGIVKILSDEKEAIPYIHIFALLTLLKQICNHPGLVDESASEMGEPLSGKWELFKELLDQSLNSGQKVVVYSQFAKMVGRIDDYLDEIGIGHVVLTGSSRDRGKLIETFNTNSDCRVFVGSLKAGGTGIDLVAGSVVIHYDRWWNAAKEDQATDRVHRIGQRRGVQVFKLVTRGTLEEKISAIIEEKRELMADIVREDDPGLLKAFDRKQLLEFLS